jgi:hypothetical protein
MTPSSPLLQLEKPGSFFVADETLTTGQAGMCDLFLLLAPASASLALRERATDKFLAVETIYPGADRAFTGPDFIRHCLKESELYRFNLHRKCTVGVVNTSATLLPAGLVRSGDEQQLLRLSVSRDDLWTGSTRVGGFDIQVVFGVPPEEISLLHQLIPGCNVVHATAAALEHAWLSASASASPVLHVVAHQGIMTVLYTVAKKLRFANSYSVADIEECAYHLLNVCEQLDIDRQAVQVELSGSPTSYDAILLRLQSFFNSIRPAGIGTFSQLGNKLKKLPAADLLPVLTLSLCE